MSRAKRAGRPYTAADLKVMRRMAAAKKSARETAKVLGRTRGALAYKAMVEGVHFMAIRQPAGVQQRLARRRQRHGMRATLKGRKRGA